LDHSDTCPVCRTSVGSKEADTERSGTVVGQAETARGAIDETADGEVGSERLVGGTAHCRLGLWLVWLCKYLVQQYKAICPLALVQLQHRYDPDPCICVYGGQPEDLADTGENRQVLDHKDEIQIFNNKIDNYDTVGYCISGTPRGILIFKLGDNSHL
jgi:hypothetical protein